MIYKKHPELNILQEWIFELLSDINITHPKELTKKYGRISKMDLFAY